MRTGSEFLELTSLLCVKTCNIVRDGIGVRRRSSFPWHTTTKHFSIAQATTKHFSSLGATTKHFHKWRCGDDEALFKSAPRFALRKPKRTCAMPLDSRGFLAAACPQKRNEKRRMG